MSVRAERKLLAAIEAGGTKFVCAAGYGSDEILQSAKIPTTTPRETFAQVASFFSKVASQHGDIAAMGVASFGPIDINPNSATYGAILNTPKPHWTGANFVKELALLKAPVMIDTDVSGAGIGEARAGAGKGLRTIAYVTVGTGIGAGVIKDGVPQSGFGHYELGHIRAPRDKNADPYPGRCPFHGDCLEGVASGPAIIERWGASLSDLPAGHEAIHLEAEYLSHLALTLILGHMPERIIFGGGVMKAPGLLEELQRKTKVLIGDYVQGAPLKGDLSDYIVAPALGDLAGVIGAMVLAQMALRNGTTP
jgi:fructokinase